MLVMIVSEVALTLTFVSFVTADFERVGVKGTNLPREIKKPFDAFVYSVFDSLL